MSTPPAEPKQPKDTGVRATEARSSKTAADRIQPSAPAAERKQPKDTGVRATEARSSKPAGPPPVPDDDEAVAEPIDETEPEYERPKPSRRRPRDDDEDDEDDRPARRRRRRDEDEDDDDEDDDDDDDNIRRRKRTAPHRGGLILTLGIISLVVWCCPLAGWIVGGIALNMANTDLSAMSIGRMDRTGRGITMAGKICAIIAVTLATINAIAGAILRITNRF